MIDLIIFLWLLACFMVFIFIMIGIPLLIIVSVCGFFAYLITGKK